MSNSKLRSNSNHRNVKSYTQGTPVKITKGSNKDCQGRISGCTIDGNYFIRIDKCPKGSSIDLFLPDEFEPLAVR